MRGKNPEMQRVNETGCCSLFCCITEGYVPRDYYEKDANIKAAVDFIVSEDLVKVGDKERLDQLSTGCSVFLNVNL